MTHNKITSEDIFKKIYEIEISMGKSGVESFEVLNREKNSLLSIYASLRIAEAIESFIIPQKSSDGGSWFSGIKPASLPRENWRELLHIQNFDEIEKGRTLAEIFAAEEKEKRKEPSFPKIFPEKDNLDPEKINKIAHLLAERFSLTAKERTEENKKKLETVNSYLETYGFELKNGILTNRNHSPETSPLEISLAYKFAVYLHRQGEPSEIELDRLKKFNLVPRKEKTAAGEETENLYYLEPEEK